MKPLLVLAGGFGTRLRAVVSEVPKPLAPVVGHPYLRYLIQQWRLQGVNDLVFLLHHQSKMIEAYLNALLDQGEFGECRISTVTENQPLGTGGAIAHAIQQRSLSGSFLVANADTWLGSGIARVADAPMPAMAIISVGNTGRYGSVAVEGSKIVSFSEKKDSQGVGWINAGLYHLEASQFDAWKGGPFSLEQNLFPELVRSGRLHAVLLETDFIDIGVPEDYHRFCRWIESGRSEVL